jgi:hypothetical protein
VHRSSSAAAAAVAMLLLAGCAAPTTGAGRDTTQRVVLPAAGGIVDYQLSEGYDPAPGVTGVVRDSGDSPAPGLYSICYINGFQTQPADRESWLADHPDLVLLDDGQPVIDVNWPDELILDTSDAGKRDRIAAILADGFADCAQKGFDAVEIDNLDSYARSGGRLDRDGAIALASLYAATAHAAGLAIAQKNSAELGERGRDEAGFDFAVAEECQRFDECALYTSVYGDLVFDIEYTDDLRGTFAEVCADPQAPASTVLRDRDLTTPSSPDFVFEAC